MAERNIKQTEMSEFTNTDWDVLLMELDTTHEQDNKKKRAISFIKKIGGKAMSWFGLSVPQTSERAIGPELSHEDTLPYFDSELDEDTDDFLEPGETVADMKIKADDILHNFALLHPGIFHNPEAQELHPSHEGEVSADNGDTLTDVIPTGFEVEVPSDVVERLETLHYVKEAPIFVEQAQDKTRTNKVKSIICDYPTSGRDPYSPNEVVESTEQESLAGLSEFLQKFASEYQGREPSLAEVAQGILDNLTYIGEKEYQEAVRGIASYWKHFLDSNPAGQLCALTEISAGGYIKSDRYFLERILGEFSEEELTKYDGRIVTQLEHLTADPEDAKVVLLDDWTISGSQMMGAISDISNKPDFKHFMPSIEIQVIAGQTHRIKDGFEVYAGGRNIIFPFRAYFMAHEAADTASYDSNRAHITGSHSSVDFDFETVVGRMASKMISVGPEPETKMPPCTNIIRPYRYMDLPRMERIKRRQEARSIERRQDINNGQGGL